MVVWLNGLLQAMPGIPAWASVFLSQEFEDLRISRLFWSYARGFRKSPLPFSFSSRKILTKIVRSVWLCELFLAAGECDLWSEESGSFSKLRNKHWWACSSPGPLFNIKWIMTKYSTHSIRGLNLPLALWPHVNVNLSMATQTVIVFTVTSEPQLLRNMY